MLPAGRADPEQAGHVLGRGLVQLAEHTVDCQHQIVADSHHHPLVPALVQLVKEDVQRVFDELFIHGGQDAAAVDTAGGGTAFGQILHRDGLAAALGAAPQQIITGNTVIIGHLHHEFQAAFPDSLFIMGKLRLADAQVAGRLFLGDAPFFPQQGDDSVEFHCHVVPSFTRIT